MKQLVKLLSLFVVILLPLQLFGAGQSTSNDAPKISWHKGPYTANMSGSTVEIPKGYAFANGDDARKFMEMNQNPTSGLEVGLLLPTNLPDEEGQWYVLFQYDKSGYVRDTEKSDLNAEKILSGIRKGTEEANEERKKRGWTPIHVLSWQTQPYYDDKTHNLTWAALAQSENAKEGETVNYSTRILGRYGVMHVDLIASPKDLGSAIPAVSSIMTGFHFESGNRYVDFVKGDKVAEYGLTALIAGGATAAAIKVGLFSKLWKLLLVFWKLVVVAFASAAAAIKRFFSRLFKRDRKQDLTFHDGEVQGDKPQDNSERDSVHTS